MTRHSCHECARELPNGTAVLRSVSLTTRAWCVQCYGFKFLGHESPVPVAGGSVPQRLMRALVAERGGVTGNPRKFLKVRG